MQRINVVDEWTKFNGHLKSERRRWNGIKKLDRPCKNEFTGPVSRRVRGNMTMEGRPSFTPIK